MEERPKYTAFSIPKRDTPLIKEEATPDRAGPANTLPLDEEKFAEVEIDLGRSRVFSGEAIRFFSSVTPAQPIEQRAVDPIRQKFFDMRSLATDRPFARNDSELFYKQAKFMEDFTDEYEGGARLIMYFPYYQHMGYEQLRTYFTWRTKVRHGEIRPTSVSYAFLYVYELISGIGVEDPLDGLNKLVAIWDAFLKYGPALEKYMPQWIKDYHVYYELPHSFSDFVKEKGLQSYYSMSLIFDADAENSLELWNSISSYDVTQSKFYSAGNEQLLKDCFEAALRGIRRFCESRNTRIEDMLIYSISRRAPWYPFKNALFYESRQQPDRRVTMPGYERYYCKNNKWTANLPIYYSSQKDFAGYIIKKTESCLRQAVKYKYKLSAEMKDRYYTSFRELKGNASKRAELDDVIEKAVMEFHRNLTRTVVTVDHINLARIRNEALRTQDKLIVPEERDEGRANSEFRVQNAELGDEERANAEFRMQNAKLRDEGEVSDETGGWAELKAALSAVEIQALLIALQGGMDIKTFADKNGIMLEVLADGINEKAADYIGDNLLELDDGMAIYGEYIENVEKMLAETRNQGTKELWEAK